MSAVSGVSAVMSSVTRGLVVSSLTGLFLELTTVATSVTNARTTADAENSNVDYVNNSFKDNATDGNTTIRPVSDEERQRYLSYLQRETTQTMMLAIMVLACVAAVGFFGNTLVIIVYWRKHHWTATETLIITIAVLDEIANTIAIPGEIYAMLHQWDSHNEIICKVRRYISANSVISSGIILVAVAVTRYRKVCYPYQWQVTERNANLTSISVCSFVALFTIPYIIINGIHTKKTPRSDIVGHECTIGDKYRQTILPLLLYAFFFILYLACSVALTVLYILIGITAWKHRKIYGGCPGTSGINAHNATSSKANSTVTDKSLNQNKSNCTACANRYNNNVVDTVIAREVASQSTSRVDGVAIKWFLAGDETIEAAIQHNDRVCTDGIGVLSSVVGEFLVKLLKTKKGITDLAIHEKRQYNNTDIENKSQLMNSSGTHGITIIESNVSNGGWKALQSNLVEIVTNGKYSDCRSQKAWPSNETSGIMNTYHSNKRSEKYGFIFYNIDLNLYSGINNNRHFKRSMQTAANIVLNELDPLSIFKWLDVINYPEDEYTKFDPICVQRETSLSVKLPLNNNLLKQTEELSTSVDNAKEIPDKLTETKNGDNNPVRGSTERTSTQRCQSSANSDGTSTIISKFSLPNITFARSRDTLLRTAFKLSLASHRYLSSRRHFGRTTVMLFIISAIYICCYFPHLAIMFVQLLAPDRLENLSTVKVAFLHLLLRTYFLNCAVNPIVYSLCDSNFRRACFKIFYCQ